MPIIYDIILFSHSFFVVLFTRKGHTKIDTFHPLQQKFILFFPIFFSFGISSFTAVVLIIQISRRSLFTRSYQTYNVNQIEIWYHIDWPGFAIFCALACILSTLPAYLSILSFNFNLNFFFLFSIVFLAVFAILPWNLCCMAIGYSLNKYK